MNILIRLAFFFLTALPLSGQWVQQTSNTDQRLITIFFLNENLGWAGGNKGIILKTTNGGNDWTPYYTGYHYNVSAIRFTDEMYGEAVLYSFDPDRRGCIIGTTDGGATWNLQFQEEGFTLHNIFFTDRYFGWAVGSNGIFLRTADGGTHWDADFISPEWMWGLYFSDRNTGWVGDGASGYIRKTTDGGSSWQNRAAPGNSRMIDIYFINPYTGWAAGQDGTILKTTDSGESWIRLSSNVTRELNSIRFSDELNGWAAGYGGILIHTTDGGSTWDNIIINTKSDLYSLYFNESGSGWIAGDNGLILHNLYGNRNEFLLKPSSSYKEDYSLGQNYPNPFNPGTTFEYSIPSASNVKIEIFDVPGNIAAVLTDEPKPAGRYSVTWNSVNFSSGIYFCVFSAGNYRSVRKIVLMK